MTQPAAMRGIPFILQNAQTSGNGNSLAIPSNFAEHRFQIIGSAGVASGAVQPETASDPNYSGTWQALGSPVTIVANAELDVAVQGILQFVRARISTPVVGGTVTVQYVGAPQP